MTPRGSCHCGKVRFALEEKPTEAIQCNCSICRRKGYLLAFTTPERFSLETPRDEITAYTFGKHVIRHQFCSTCGCAPFGEGTAPDGRAMVAVNLRCLDEVNLGSLTVTDVDGASF